MAGKYDSATCSVKSLCTVPVAMDCKVSKNLIPLEIEISSTNATVPVSTGIDMFARSDLGVKT